MNTYTGENTMLIPCLWPHEREIEEIDCEFCEGKGLVPDEEDDAVTFAGITLQKAIPCEECRGTGRREA